MLNNNIAYACLTQYCEGGNSDHIIMNWIQNDLTEINYTYGDFESESNKIANILTDLGVQSGDVVSIFLPRSPILISSFFGIIKLQALSCILFSTLGEDALLDRLGNSQAKFVITKKSLVRKIIANKHKLPDLRGILVVDQEENQSEFVLSLASLLSDADARFEYEHRVDSETPAFLQYTSGSTGKPKGALHVHVAILDIIQSFKEIIGLAPEDIYWCTADPAWITGLSYGIIAPFTTRSASVQFSGTYHAENWLKILKEKQIRKIYFRPGVARFTADWERYITAFVDGDVTADQMAEVLQSAVLVP